MQGGVLPPACSLLGDGGSDLKWMFSSQFMEGPPANVADPMSLLFSLVSDDGSDLKSMFSSQFMEEPLPNVDDPISILFSLLSDDGSDLKSKFPSQFMEEPLANVGDPISVLLSQFRDWLPANGVEPMSPLSRQFTGAAAPVQSGEPMPMLSSEFMEGPPANGVEPISLLSSQFTGAASPVQSGEPMPMLSSEFMEGPPDNGVEPISLLSSQFTGAASPVQSGEPMPMLSSEFMEGPPANGVEPISLLSSQFTGAAAPVQSGEPMPTLIVAAEQIYNDDLESVWRSHFLTGATPPAQNSNVAGPAFSSGFFAGVAPPAHISDAEESAFSSQFPGAAAPAPAHDGDLKSMLTSQFTGVPAFSRQFTGTPALSWADNGDLKPGFSGQFIGAEVPLYDNGSMSIFSLQSPLTGAAGGDPMPMFPSQFTKALTPAHGGDSMSVLGNQFTRAAVPVNGGNPMFAFSGQHTADNLPMSMFSNQLMGTTPAPAPAYGEDAMFWRQHKQASAPAHSTDRMSMFSSQLNGAPAPAPALRAYPNNGTQNAAKILSGNSVENEQRQKNLHVSTRKILEVKAESPGWGNDGIFNKNWGQNDAGDGSFPVVPSLQPPTNLLQGRPLKVLPPRLRQTPPKKGKKVNNWTEDEQRLFLRGLNNCEKGDWNRISREYVKTKTPSQVASHAQKYFIRLKDKEEGRVTGKRKSIHDITLD